MARPALAITAGRQRLSWCPAAAAVRSAGVGSFETGVLVVVTPECVWCGTGSSRGRAGWGATATAGEVSAGG